jgi:hypothetical protein
MAASDEMTDLATTVLSRVAPRLSPWVRRWLVTTIATQSPPDPVATYLQLEDQSPQNPDAAVSIAARVLRRHAVGLAVNQRLHRADLIASPVQDEIDFADTAPGVEFSQDVGDITASPTVSDNLLPWSPPQQHTRQTTPAVPTSDSAGLSLARPPAPMSPAASTSVQPVPTSSPTETPATSAWDPTKSKTAALRERVRRAIASMQTSDSPSTEPPAAPGAHAPDAASAPAQAPTGVETPSPAPSPDARPVSPQVRRLQARSRVEVLSTNAPPPHLDARRLSRPRLS